jgi:polyphenol oxidase
VFAFRQSLRSVEVAFTDRSGGVSPEPFDSLNLAAVGLDDREHVQQNLSRVLEAFAGSADASVALMHQVHGADVAVVGHPGDTTAGVVAPGRVTAGPDELPEVDGLVTAVPEVTLVVRVADCVPVLLADPGAGVVAALHVGRAGLTRGVVAAGLETMARQGAGRLTGWLGPSVCGRCYEVPAELRDEVCAAVPEAWGETSWGTPSVDVAAGVTAQLTRAGVEVVDASRCTREDEALFSYRRDGERAGRMAGLVRLCG